jgi:dipeptide/tripeptide permease
MVFSVLYDCDVNPIFFKYDKWHITDKDARPIEVVTASVAIIVGILFFLTLTAPTTTTVNNQTTTIVNNPDVNDNSVLNVPLTSLIALIVVPFAFSAIVTPIWRHVEFRKHRGISGVKLGLIFMIAGFVWLIITIFLIYLSGGVEEQASSLHLYHVKMIITSIWYQLL